MYKIIDRLLNKIFYYRNLENKSNSDINLRSRHLTVKQLEKDFEQLHETSTGIYNDNYELWIRLHLTITGCGFMHPEFANTISETIYMWHMLPKLKIKKKYKINFIVNYILERRWNDVRIKNNRYIISKHEVKRAYPSNKITIKDTRTKISYDDLPRISTKAKEAV